MDKLHILVVDDDRDFGESLAELLHNNGHAVDLACCGEEAIERFRTRDYDLTFMDVRLPGISGVESFLAIHQLKPNARVYMMTGFSVKELLDQAVANGARGVLRKPLDVRRLLGLVNRIKPEGILVADDDPDFVASIRELLDHQGYAVYVARDGCEALDQIRTGRIDILILDLCMPLLCGLEVYMQLRQKGHSLPTIIVTAYAQEEAEDLKKLRGMHVTGVLTKPFRPEDLLRELTVLRGGRPERPSPDSSPRP
jgi:two-component system, NtrC family, response regulator HydG